MTHGNDNRQSYELDNRDETPPYHYLAHQSNNGTKGLGSPIKQMYTGQYRSNELLKSPSKKHKRSTTSVHHSKSSLIKSNPMMHKSDTSINNEDINKFKHRKSKSTSNVALSSLANDSKNAVLSSSQSQYAKPNQSRYLGHTVYFHK